MLVFERQEKTAVAILLLVTGVCLVGTYILDGMGKEEFSKDYTPGLPDGTLVRLGGTVGSLNPAAGGNLFLEVSGVRVFIPVSAGTVQDVQEGKGVHIIGTVQHWKGKEEIMIEDLADIQLTS